MSRPILCGVAGAGVFGGYHAAKLAGARDATLARVFDADAGRAAARAAEHGAKPHADLAGFLDGLDAVIVATPATTHGAIAQAALDTGVHVLVEKPLALTLEDAGRLIETATARGLVLQVGHQEAYVASALGLLGRQGVTGLRSRRLNTPSGRAGDVSVVMDLMIHDLDLLARLAGTDEAVVTDCRADGPPGGPADRVVAALRIGGIEAALEASRLEEAATRDLALVLPDGEIRLDFLARQATNTTPTPLRSALGEGAALADPLGYGTHLFVDAVRGARNEQVTGEQGRAALRLALTVEAAAREVL